MNRGYSRGHNSAISVSNQYFVTAVSLAVTVILAAGALFSFSTARADVSAKQATSSWQTMFNVERMCKKVDACTNAKVTKRGIRMKGQQEMSGISVDFKVLIANKGPAVNGVQPALAKVRTNFGNVRVPLQLSMAGSGGKEVLVADVGQVTADGLVASFAGSQLDEMSNQTYRVTKKKAKKMLAKLSSGSTAGYPSFL